VEEARQRLGSGDLRKPHWMDLLPPLPGAEALPDAPNAFKRAALGRQWSRPVVTSAHAPEPEVIAAPSPQLLRLWKRQKAEWDARSAGSVQ
jgi:hypothetical protein